MRNCWKVLPLLITLAAAFAAFAPASGAATMTVSLQGRRVASRDVPGYAREVFAYVLKNGRAPKGYVGGRVWQNREHRLPSGGDYREYDVHPKVRGVNSNYLNVIIS